MSELIRVLVVDDHPIVRQGMNFLLRPKHGMELVGEARDGSEAVQKARDLNPDVILMDLVMPRKDGIQAISEIIEENPEARILVLTSFVEEEKVVSAIKAGASGYLMKDSSPDELLSAIQEVHRGNLFMPQEIARKMINTFDSGSRPDPDHPPKPQDVLSQREVEVLRLLADGLSNKDMAGHLTVSEVTVRFHVSSILRKLNLSNRTQAAVYAYRSGLVDPDTKSPLE